VRAKAGSIGCTSRLAFGKSGSAGSKLRAFEVSRASDAREILLNPPGDA
jgi:hypothetical protein